MKNTPDQTHKSSWFLSGQGEMRDKTINFNWSKTSVGGVEQWPQSLRTLITAMLSSQFPMLLWWGDELLQFYNDAYKEILGVNGKHPTALGQSAQECWTEIWDIVQPMIAQVLAGGSTWSEDQLIPIYRNGQIENVYWTFGYSPVHNESGAINGVLVICNETTKKVVSQKHLARQFSNLFEQAPVAICILKGKDYVIEMINEQMAAMWHRTIEAVLNKPAFEVLSELRDQGFKELLDSVYDTGKRFITEELPISLMRNEKLEQAYIKFIYEPFREEDGTISGVMALAHEITEQVLARKKIEEAEQKTRIVIESAEIGVYEINLLTNKVTGDDMFFKLFDSNNGVSRSELVAMVPPADLPIREMAHKAALDSGRLYYETQIIHKDKSVHWLKFNGKIFYDENKVPVRLVGVVNDISEQKQVEKQKDDFLSLASHELRTPITTIKAYGQLAEILFEKSDNLEALGLLKKMGIQVKKLTTLIENLLDITKIQQGQLIFDEAVFNFDAFVKEGIDDMQKINLKHTINSSLEASCEIFADKDRLGQVLNNLILNAVKYSPNAASILVTTKSINNGVQLAVQDNGMGIAPENLEKIFQKFYRVGGDDKTGFSGMGIGLYICMEIVRRLDGKIWAQSIIDKGSTFYVWLPIDNRVNGTMLYQL